MVPSFVSWIITFLMAASVWPQAYMAKAFAPSMLKDVMPSLSHQRMGRALPWDVSSKLLTLRAGMTNTETSSDDTSSASSTLFKFYTFENGMCPYAARTWITFLELELPFEIVPVNRGDKDNWYQKINPKGKVPAIQNTEDGTVLYESAICDEYLSDLARQMEKDAPAGQKAWKLMPVAASDRAVLRLLNDHVDTKLAPAQIKCLMNKDVEKDTEMIESVETALDALQDSLIVTGGPYLMGDDFTLADVHVLPFFLRLVVSLKHFKDYEVPKEKFSRLLAWFDLCSARESVKAAAKSEEQIIEMYKRFVEMDYAFGGLNK